MMYDVVVVGTGPAGSSAVLELVRTSNMRILIIDKSRLPRQKPCGGAMPSSVEGLLNLNLSNVIENRTKKIKLYHNYEDEANKENIDTLLLVNRQKFDRFILEEADKISSGMLDIWDNCMLDTYIQNEKDIDVYIHGKQCIKTRYLIGADGALGRVASQAGLMKKRKFAPSLDAEIVVEEKYYALCRDTMVMNYFCLPHGYGWIFPKGQNSLSCGVATWGKPVNLQKELEAFINQSIDKNKIENIVVKGYPIPIYQGCKEISNQSVLLVGDAAGLVDPVTGEGIRFAIQSGQIAARCIVEIEQKSGMADDSVSSMYQKKIDETIGKVLKEKLRFVSLAFKHHPQMFYQVFAKNMVYTTE